ncbi:hypothetical protein AB0J52_29715, partial [Spirillospora sp. NPDC049652]
MSTRLIALIAVPTIVAALLAGYRVSVFTSNAGDYTRIGKMATLSDRLAALSHQLEGERDTLALRAASSRAVSAADLQKRE